MDALSRPIANKNVIISLIGSDEKVFLTTNSQGIVSFVLNLTEGNYSYNVSFEGDSELDLSDLIFNVSVNRIKTSFEDSSFIMGITTLTKSNDTINIILLDENSNPLVNKEIALFIKELNENHTLNTDANGRASFNLDLLKGNYTFVLGYEGDEIYKETSSEFKVTAIKRESPFMLVGDSEISSSEEFTVCLVDRKFNVLSDKLVTLTLVDSKFRTFVYNVTSDEKGVASLSGINGGNYTVSGLFTNDDLYEDASFNSIKLTVLGAITVINIPDYIKYADGIAKIKVIFTDYYGDSIADKLIHIVLNNEAYDFTTDVNGAINFNVSLNEGNYPISAKFIGDENYLPSNVTKEITVTSSNIITVYHTGDDTRDIQAAIDDAENGDIILLGDYDYTNVNCINITKDLDIKGNNTSIKSTENAPCIFNISSKSESDINNVTIEGIEFLVNNGDVIVLANAVNSSNPLSIDVPFITVKNNVIVESDENVVPESVVVLELDSERGILSTNSEIIVVDNTISAGIAPFRFEVSSVQNGSNVNISEQSFANKIPTAIEYEDMVTTAVDVDSDGSIGENFTITLKDNEGNLLAGKEVQFGFNGKIYNKTTGADGKAYLQINLRRADIYTFAVSFKGDNMYDGDFAVAKITVKKQNPNFVVPNKSYKTSAKTKTLTATFKSAKGNFVAGKKVTFTVGGKSYAATTNAKGVATVNVSLSSKGSYSFTAKFAGDNTYAAITKTAKLTLS